MTLRGIFTRRLRLLVDTATGVEASLEYLQLRDLLDAISHNQWLTDSWEQSNRQYG